MKLRQLHMWPGVLTSTSVNFLFGRENFCKLPSIFHAAGRPVNFQQHSVWATDFPLTSVKLPCGLETFWQLLATSGNFPSGWLKFRQLPSTFLQPEHICQHPSNFRAVGRTSVNLRCCRETFCQIPLTFRVAGWPSVNFRQLCKRMGELPSTFHVAIRPSVNFQYCQENFRKNP